MKDIQEIIASSLNHEQGPANEDQTIQEEASQVVDTAWYKQPTTIKDASPFTKYFSKIQSDCIIVKAEEENPFYNPAYITFLQKNFMP